MRSAFPESGRAKDDGFAIVIALLVTMVSFILVTAVLAQAMHNVTKSGYLRRRTAAIHAAEAGLNWYSNLLSSTRIVQITGGGGWSPNSPSSGWWTRSGATEVSTAPDRATFTLSVFYSATNVCSTAPCSATGLTPLDLVEPLPDPVYAIVRSTGEAGGVRRVLESAIRLHPVTGGADSNFGVIATSLCFDSGGDLEIRGGSLHVLDPIPTPLPSLYPCTVTSGGVAVGNNRLVIAGSLTIDDGGFSIGTSAAGAKLNIGGDLWAEGAVVLGGSGGSGSSTACSPSDLCVNGDAIGYPTVTVDAGATVLGELYPCPSACPPSTDTFPIITTGASEWLNWQAVTVATGADALTQMVTTSVDTAYFVAATSGTACMTDFAGSYIISSNIAIVSSCGFKISGDSAVDIAGTGSLTLVSAWPGTTSSPGAQPNCSTSARDITIEQNPSIARPLFVYTPCRLFLQNNSSNTLEGQYVARFIQVKNSSVLNTNIGPAGARPPGILSGFTQDVRYVKEIVL